MSQSTRSAERGSVVVVLLVVIAVTLLALGLIGACSRRPPEQPSDGGCPACGQDAGRPSGPDGSVPDAGAPPDAGQPDGGLPDGEARARARCESAPPLRLGLGNTYRGSTADAGDLLQPSCQYRTRGPEAAYRLDVPLRAYAQLWTSGRDCDAVLSLWPQACAGEELVCANTVCVLFPNPSIQTVLDAGSYTLVVDTDAPDFDYTLHSEVIPAQEPVGNDTCQRSWRVPAIGGFFQGDTTGMADDLQGRCATADGGAPDAIFRLDLRSRSTVSANTRGSQFDTLLSIREGDCGGRELACDDNGIFSEPSDLAFAESSLSVTLDAGMYFLVLDGVRRPDGGLPSEGRYTLEVDIRSPELDGRFVTCVPPCAEGESCDQDVCRPCNNALNCGPQCLTCSGSTPRCSSAGTCVECNASADCPLSRPCCQANVCTLSTTGCL